MIGSLNEIGATMAKACGGAGFPVGLARSAAAAGVWLSARDLDGVGAVLAATAAEYQPGRAIVFDDDSARAASSSVVHCGPSLFDLLVSGHAPLATITSPDSPLLLVGLAGVVAHAHDVAFALVAESAEALVSSSGVDNAMALADASHIDITQTDSSAASAFDAPRGVDVAAEDWAALQALAHRTYVPATDASRVRGAGASLTDND